MNKNVKPQTIPKYCTTITLEADISGVLLLHLSWSQWQTTASSNSPSLNFRTSSVHTYSPLKRKVFTDGLEICILHVY